jgi:hypothetical protein
VGARVGKAFEYAEILDDQGYDMLVIVSTGVFHALYLVGI